MKARLTREALEGDMLVAAVMDKHRQCTCHRIFETAVCGQYAVLAGWKVRCDTSIHYTRDFIDPGCIVTVQEAMRRRYHFCENELCFKGQIEEVPE